MVIVTQLEARYSKTAFVRIYVNCKQLILFKQALWNWKRKLDWKRSATIQPVYPQ